jgi:hypothetical protein
MTLVVIVVLYMFVSAVVARLRGLFDTHDARDTAVAWTAAALSRRGMDLNRIQPR